MTVALSKRERNKAANREAILAAGEEVFAELGFGAASIRDIIRRTDLAAGTFYNYFPDKESVLLALVEDRVQPLRAAMREARARSTTLEEFVREGFGAFFTFIASDPRLLGLLQRNAGTLRTMLDEPVLYAGTEDLFRDLAEAVRRGALPPSVDVDYVAGAMTGAGLEIAVRMVERDPVDPEAATEFAAALFLGGLSRPTA